MDLTIPSRRYPVGIQGFPKLRNGGFVYIDKTDYIWRLAHENGSSFFLSRPRRFGKSMLVSTMQAYFEGRRELFSGTALERLETAWETWPVIRLDLSTVKTRDLDALEARLSDILRNLENEFAGGTRLAETLGGRLQALITHVHARVLHSSQGVRCGPSLRLSHGYHQVQPAFHLLGTQQSHEYQHGPGICRHLRYYRGGAR